LKKLISIITAAATVFLIAANPIQAEQIVIQKGDTLWDLSREYNTTVKSIMEENNLVDDLIFPDHTLEISPIKNLTITEGNTLTQPVQGEEQSENNSVEATNLAVSEKPAPENETVAEEPAGKEITVAATAYTANCQGCSGITKTGVNLNANPDQKVIAVDPAVIPLGTKVHVEGYGYATAEDIGGGINGHEIDVFIPKQSDALDWGRKQVKVTIID
jgi:3D (Asp-Asp-Asp) domain-containing protein